jgi:hypothetical protein
LSETLLELNLTGTIVFDWSLKFLGEFVAITRLLPEPFKDESPSFGRLVYAAGASNEPPIPTVMVELPLVNRNGSELVRT